MVDAEGEPLRLAVEAEPYLVTPNQREAEALVGHEFTDDEDMALALGEIEALGARNVLITVESGCYALVKEERSETRLRATAPRLQALSGVGAGDTLLAGFIAARVGGRTLEESIRAGVAAGAASVLEQGPGRFDPREMSRIAGLVTVAPLARVGHEA
jgi:1-phosphofructokinase/tagatose 6-phosphate kinase